MEKQRKPMKVVQVTTSSRGGAGIAAMRLHNALRNQGVASAFASRDITIDFDGKKIADDFFAYKRTPLTKRILRKLQLAGPSMEQKYRAEIASIEPQLSFEMLSLPFSPYRLHEHPLLQEADVINFHWMSKLLDYPSFFQRNTKPVVWTLHDRVYSIISGMNRKTRMRLQ